MREIIKFVYDRTIRDLLPKKIGTYNGIAVRCVPLLDNTDVFPRYPKRTLIKLTRDAVQRGDSVGIVGGGPGVSTVAAARSSGPEGAVTVYEASDDLLPRLAETIRVNGVEDMTTVNHAIVGEAHDIDGEPGDAATIPPSELPPYDVLQLDCEGAELSILSRLEDFPRQVIVETHPDQGADTGTVTNLLNEAGYSITTSKPDRSSGDILLATQDF